MIALVNMSTTKYTVLMWQEADADFEALTELNRPQLPNKD